MKDLLEEKDQKLDFPPIQEQTANLVKAVGKAALASVKGEKVFVSEEVKADRQVICDGCEFYCRYNKRCYKCGCPTEYKLSLATESCPVDKWQATEKKKPSFMSVDLNQK